MNEEQSHTAKKLCIDHWGYISQVLITHGADELAMRISEHHYKTAFIHGFKHGIEEMNEAQAKPDDGPVTLTDLQAEKMGYLIEKGGALGDVTQTYEIIMQDGTRCTVDSGGRVVWAQEVDVR